MNSQRDSRTCQIGYFSNIQTAEIAAGMLRNAGIMCEVENTTLASLLPMTDTWSPIRLLVPESQAARARQLLENHGE